MHSSDRCLLNFGKKRIFMHRIIALFATFALAQLVAAAPFQNGSFENGSPIASPAPCFVILPNGSTNIIGWTVILGDIDWQSPACGVQSQTDGIASLDLVGDQSIGGIQQTFDTVPGQTYVVKFDLNGNFGGPPVVKPLRVTVAGVTHNYTFDTTGETLANAASFWSTKSFSFVATASGSTIAFVSDTTGTGVNAGAVLDNVRITLLATDLPLDWAQWAAALLILGAAALLARRRFRDGA
jgi:choice-of-anchor C domain-containing protein